MAMLERALIRHTVRHRCPSCNSLRLPTPRFSDTRPSAWQLAQRIQSLSRRSQAILLTDIFHGEAQRRILIQARIGTISARFRSRCMIHPA